MQSMIGSMFECSSKTGKSEVAPQHDAENRRDSNPEAALGCDDVHLWIASLNRPGAEVAALRRTLTSDELERAGRFHFKNDRDYFIVARGLLRAILARYLKKKPGEIRFDYGSHGKPELRVKNGKPPLRFNLAHSRDYAIYAVARSRAVGVDIEFIRPEFAKEEIAERFFSGAEVGALRVLPEKLQATGFFNCWTRKEAFLKALGDGLSRPLDEFDVSLAPDQPARLLRVGWNSSEASRWFLESLEPVRGYVAAVAVEGPRYRMMTISWSEDPASRRNFNF